MSTFTLDTNGLPVEQNPLDIQRVQELLAQHQINLTQISVMQNELENLKIKDQALINELSSITTLKNIDPAILDKINELPEFAKVESAQDIAQVSNLIQ